MAKNQRARVILGFVDRADGEQEARAVESGFDFAQELRVCHFSEKKCGDRVLVF